MADDRDRLSPLANGEVGGLAETRDELGQSRLRETDEPSLAAKIGDRVDSPAQPVRIGVRVPVEQAVIGQGRQGARDLALFPAKLLGDRRDREPAAFRRALAGDDEERLDSPADACFSRPSRFSTSWPPPARM